MIAVARTCGLIFIILDVLKPLEHKRLIEKELESFGIRLNKDPPNIWFKKKDKGGINMTAPVSGGGGREGGGGGESGGGTGRERRMKEREESGWIGLVTKLIASQQRK